MVFFGKNISKAWYIYEGLSLTLGTVSGRGMFLSWVFVEQLLPVLPVLRYSSKNWPVSPGTTSEHTVTLASVTSSNLPSSSSFLHLFCVVLLCTIVFILLRISVCFDERVLFLKCRIAEKYNDQLSPWLELL